MEMPSFGNPWWLLLLPPFYYLLWRLQKRSFIPATRKKRLFWFVFRCVLVTLLTFALAGLQFSTTLRKNQTLFVVDASDSVAPQQKERAIHFLNDALRRIQMPDQAGLVLFGTQAEVERFPAAPHLVQRFESRVDSRQTNLENALRLADGVMADDYQKNIVILSDGLENAGDAVRLAESLREKGVTFQGFYLEPANLVEAQIENVRVPSETRLKEPFVLEIITNSNQRMSGLLQILRNGELLQEGTVQLSEAQKGIIRIPQRITEPGLYRYDVRLKPEKDFQIENNSAQAWISVEGPPRILLVDQEPGEMRRLAEALEVRGFSVDVKEGRYFPRTLSDLMLYQAVLIRNVPASTIQSQMPLVQQYVREFGGGFAMLGGKKSFGPGGYYQTPVETVLPVRMDLVNKKYLADVAMVIVIDKSGSMSYTDRGRQKIDLADEGGSRVASLLKETDQLGVIAVDSVPKWTYELQRLRNKADAIDAIVSIRAGGGGIYVYSGLKEAYEALKPVKASVKHVILFADTADCEEQTGPNGESSLALAARALEEDQITTTSIGIGQTGDRDVQYLEQLATVAAGRFYFTSDMFTLPQIFAQESAVVQRYYITEETFSPAIKQAEPLLTGLTPSPDLDGYVATTGKNFATISMVSHREDPVLAYWRYGLGQSLAFTSDPVGAWGTKWLAWPDWQRFWAQTGRYLARTYEPGRFQVSFQSKDNSTTVIVDALDQEQNAGSSWQGVVVDSTGKEHRLSFSRTSHGRYEASLPAAGALFGKVFRLQGDHVAGENIVQFAGSRNMEYEISPNGKERLKKIAGRLLESADQLRLDSKTALDVQSVRPQLLAWAIWLFLLDVAFRKLDTGMFRRSKKLQPVPVPASIPLQQLKMRKRALEREDAGSHVLEIESEPPMTEPKKPEEPKVEADSDYMNRLKEAKRRKNN